MIFGVLNLSFWGYVLTTVVLTQISIAGVTIYLHRHQTHRALNLHPIISHFFRFWLWLATGQVTAQWVAVHRKHHATTDIEGDPHSPVVFGIKKVLLEGTELYRAARKDREIIEKYSHGTPNDWIERNVYSRHSSKGVFLMLLIDVLLFGVPGVSIWAIQMMWIPFWAAGVLNGVGHFFGYRNYETPDASRNIFPLAFWIGGEELHNNHHAFASSAKFSQKWWEFDIGWMYICILSFLKLATVKKLPPKLMQQANKTQIDRSTVKAVIGNRFQVMSHYYKEVTRPILKHVKRNHIQNGLDKHAFIGANRILRRQNNLLSTKENSRLQALLSHYEMLRTIHNYRESLQNVWLKAAKSQEELIGTLQQWCKQAEESGIEVLRQFSQRLKNYTPA
ncbi:MAG: aminotransferase [Legionellales bacterium RIFCSPHIGHO2_12_FULL_42_9]|nr:MAG: aminotransferase [Legionellales bacterium RIFCSPHIGHO2_12_FULL_42_9]